MKHLMTFENYNSSNIENFRYISIEKNENNLKLILNTEGKLFLEEADPEKIKSETIAFDLFDDVQGNSEYRFHHNLGEMGFGLTDAPGITDGYNFDEDGKFVENDDTANVYYYNDYMIKNFIEELTKYGHVFFHKA